MDFENVLKTLYNSYRDDLNIVKNQDKEHYFQQGDSYLQDSDNLMIERIISSQIYEERRRQGTSHTTSSNSP